MPKRLSTATTTTISFTIESVLENREMAAWMAVVMNAWSNLEIELGRSLATFLGTQPKVGLAIYEAIYSGPLRRSVLMKVAKASDSGELEAKVFCELVNLLKELGEDRNKVAHGIWGYSLQHPNALLRISQEAVLENEVAQMAAPGQAILGAYSDNIEVYDKDDLVAIYFRILHLEKLFNLFWHWNDPGHPLRDGWRQQLCDEPRLAEILSPPKRGRGNRPSKPRQ
jgi:hypothetical protein